MGRGRHNGKFRPGQETKKKDPDAVPILKFGPNNHSMQLREVLFKKALEEYGLLGKLILKGKIEELEEPNRTLYDLDDEYEKLDYLEEMKTYRKLKNDLSEESLKAVKKVKEWSDIEEEVDPEKLWLILVHKHRVHSTSKVAAVW
jgi:hypothetical protein